MRRSLSAASAVLATAAMIAVPTSQASAGDDHSVSIAGVIHIVDDESWPWSDEVGSISYNETISIGKNINERTYTASGCVGGEVRVEASYRVVHEGNAIRVYPTFRLYEGTSCGNGDLDGVTTAASFPLDSGWQTSGEYHVYNTAEGGDRADITMTVTNSSY